MTPTLRQFSIFVATAESGSLSKASKQLFITQAAASMALKTMESALEQTLFDRHGKRLTITDYGLWLLPRAKRMLELTEEVGAGPDEDLQGSLSIGASQTVANHVLAPYHSKLLTRHPKLQLNLEVANSREICAQLIAHKLPLAVVEANPQLPGLSFTPWLEDELVVIAGKTHPLALQSHVSQSDLQHYPWLLREAGSGTRSVLERAMGRDFERLDIAHQLNHPASLLRLCADGLGLACVSKRTAARGLQAGEIALVSTALSLKRRFFVVQREHEEPTQLAKAYLNVLSV